MSIKMRQKVERKIASRLVKDGLAAGYSISVNNGGDEDEIESSRGYKTIMGAMFATDDEHLIFHKDGKRFGWVYFVYGNDGWDVIADYATNLEHIMAGADKISDQYS